MDLSLNHNNILLHQFKKEDLSFVEVFPTFKEGLFPRILSLDSSGNLEWIPLPDPSIFNPLENILFAKGEQLGLGRSPLFSYKLDIAVPNNSIMTAFHIGDGLRGFSMGNGTSSGYLPEIIGMGMSEEDAGLYFIGRAGNHKSSNIPLIVFDGRNSADGELYNRPILGVTSANYNSYSFSINYNGDINSEGEINAKDFILNGSSIKALIGIISEQQSEINTLKDQIKQVLDRK